MKFKDRKRPSPGRVPNKTKPEGPTPRHIPSKLPEANGEERILKAAGAGSPQAGLSRAPPHDRWKPAPSCPSQSAVRMEVAPPRFRGSLALTIVFSGSVC